MTCNDGVGDDGDVDYLDTNKACQMKRMVKEMTAILVLLGEQSCDNPDDDD